MVISDQLSEIIAKASSDFLVDPSLIRAICAVESGWIQWRSRFEPNWKYFVTPQLYASHLGITVETEQIQQQTSWGLMQLIGSVSRELQFGGHLPQLCDPEIGVHYGTKKLMELQRRHVALGDVIASYNAGSPIMVNGQYMNQKYVDEVLKNMKSSIDGSIRST